eukprot:5963110-Prymnesium_polylepis.1
MAAQRRERGGGDDERQDEVDPPERHLPEADHLLDREAVHVRRAENDGERDTRDGEGDAGEHAHRDHLLVDELVERDVGHELHRLERHEDRRRGEREGGKVEERADDEDTHADAPRPA